jgi:hypothetical protein
MSSCLRAFGAFGGRCTAQHLDVVLALCLLRLAEGAQWTCSPGDVMFEVHSCLRCTAHHPSCVCIRCAFTACALGLVMGVFVTREHVRHNKSGIAHRGRTGINHVRELPTKLNHFCSVGQGNLPNRTREPQVCL